MEALAGKGAQLATIRSSTVFRRIFMPWLVLTLLAAVLTLWNGLAPTHLPRIALAATAHTLLGIASRFRPRLPAPLSTPAPCPPARPQLPRQSSVGLLPPHRIDERGATTGRRVSVLLMFPRLSP